MSWIDSVPTGWQVKRLKYLGTARNGLTYAPEDVVDDGILVLRSSNIQNNALSFDDNIYVNKRIPHEIVLRENDLLICSRNGSSDLIGKCALIDKEMAGNTYGAFMCVYRSPNNKFVYWVLLSDIFGFYLSSYLTSTINQLTNANLLNIEILVPPLTEQRSITAFLDDRCGYVDGIIADLERQLEILRQHKKALITETVTKGLDKSVPMKDSGIVGIGQIPSHYELKKLKHIVATKITDGPHETPDLIDDGIPFLSAESVKEGILDFNYKRGYISLKDHQAFCRKCKPQLHDIFMVKSGATTGRTGMVMTEEEFSVWSPLALIRCDDIHIKQQFVYYSMLSNYFTLSVELAWSYGTQQNIGMGVIENLRIVLPPTTEQETIVEFLNVKCAEMDALIAEKQHSVETMRQYKRSLIYEYVTGKKRVVS